MSEGRIISGIIIENDEGDYYELWKGFRLSKEDEEAVWNILSRYETEGGSVSGTWQQILEESIFGNDSECL